MTIDLSQEELLPRLQVVVYLLAACAVALTLYDQYRQGLYPLVLSNAIAIPAFLFSAIFIYLKRDQRGYERINYALIFTLAGLALYQLPHYPLQMTHYLYALPLFSFFCLPLRAATLISALLGMILVAMLWLDRGFLVALRTAANFGLLLGSAWCFAYLTLLKGWSLKRLALTDRISGAYNRRHFFQALTREIARGQSARQSVSLIALVLDDYRQLIDIHGSREMTAFLPRFVTSAQRLIRAGDEIFRLDDDLFVLVLPDCHEDGAIVLMERVKRSLQQRAWKPFAELSLRAVALGVHAGDEARDVEKRLLARLQKQQRASLQLAAFTE